MASENCRTSGHTNSGDGGAPRPRLRFLAAALFALLAAALFLFWLHAKKEGQEDRTAVVTLDGQILYTFDLASIRDTETYVVGERGSQNTIQVSPEGIGVISADCPDQICVRQGIRAHGPEPIVCLPHKLSITFSSNAGSDGSDGLDAVAGQ